jgi:deoxyribonuclease-1
MKIRIGAVVSVLLICCTNATAQQNIFDDYEHARVNAFWPKLYSNGGTTLYCGLAFGPDRKAHNGLDVNVEHIYAASWIAKHHGCNDRDLCRGVGDLHNLWPAIMKINSSRGNLPFGEIPKDDHRRFTEFCPDYERTGDGGGMVEPRDDVKGDVARSILYMLETYNLPCPPGMTVKMLLTWHGQDPPDDLERWREEIIFDLQGTMNRWVRRP